jgi:hypothetical protein
VACSRPSPTGFRCPHPTGPASASSSTTTNPAAGVPIRSELPGWQPRLLSGGAGDQESSDHAGRLGWGGGRDPARWSSAASPGGGARPRRGRARGRHLRARCRLGRGRAEIAAGPAACRRQWAGGPGGRAAPAPGLDVHDGPAVRHQHRLPPHPRPAGIPGRRNRCARWPAGARPADPGGRRGLGVPGRGEHMARSSVLSRLRQRAVRRAGSRLPAGRRLQPRLGPGPGQGGPSCREEHPDEQIYLLYFGTARPSSYGLDAVDLRKVPPGDLDDLHGILLASASRRALYDDPGFDELRRREPIAQIGHSILVYQL